MRLEDFLAKLEQVRKLRAGSYAAQCPAHDDRIGSLVVSMSSDTMRLLVRCHAGCDTTQVVQAVGYELRDLFCADPIDADGVVNIGRVRPTQADKAEKMRVLEDNLSRPAGGTSSMPPEHVVDAWIEALTVEMRDRLRQLKGWTPTALLEARAGWDGTRITLPVYDPGMERVTSLVRYLPGGTPKTIAVGPRELWPAPESLPEGDVWLVEGEPDRVSALTLGLRAVAVPGVATWKPGWAERFTDRRVTVCLDCDEQGRAATSTRVLELAEAGVHARPVDLFPGRADGYDLGDALAAAYADGRVDELIRYLLRLERDAWEEAA